MLRIVAACTLFAACGPIGPPRPSDSDTDPPAGRVLLVPSQLTFRIQASQAPSQPQTVQVVNDTRFDVTVFNLTEIQGDASFRVADASVGRFLQLRPGDAVEIPFLFDPPHGGRFTARVPIGTSPADDPGDIELIGEAGGPTPDLKSEQAADTLQYCASPVTVSLANQGPDQLVVRGFRLSEAEDCAAFSVTDPTGEVAAEGERLDLKVAFQPQKPGPHACELTILTDVSDPPRVTLRGNGLATEIVEERFNTSDGSGLNLLFLHDDGAPDVAGHRAELKEGLPRLIDGLNEEGIDWRLTAASTFDACTAGPYTYATPANSLGDTLELLEDNLFDPREEVWADRPLALLGDVSSRSRGRCFLRWLEDWDPVHVVIVAGREDTSGSSPSAWLNSARAELMTPVHVTTITPTSGCGPAASRLVSAAEQSGGLRLDLCAASWDAHWAEIVARSSTLRQSRDTFGLAAAPLDRSVQVAVNGVATTAWTLTDAQNLRLNQIFPDGSAVTVRYANADTCR